MREGIDDNAKEKLSKVMHMTESVRSMQCSPPPYCFSTRNSCHEVRLTVWTSIGNAETSLK